MKKFGKVSIGVHGKDLPKFSDQLDEKKEWWKHKSDYNEEPANISLKKLKQDRNIFAKNDPILIADAS